MGVTWIRVEMRRSNVCYDTPFVIVFVMHYKNTYPKYVDIGCHDAISQLLIGKVIALLPRN